MNTLRLLFVFLVTTAASTAGTVNLLPLKPTAGSELTIEFKPSTEQKSEFTSLDKLHAVVYAFRADEDVPTAHEVELSEDDGRYTGDYEIANNDVYLMVKVGDGAMYDTHRGLYWDTFVYDNKKRVPFASLRAATSWLGGLPEPCSRKADQIEALRLFEEELADYPNNVAAQVNTVFLKLSLKQVSPEQANTQLTQITTNNAVPSSALDAIALAQAYSQTGQTQKSIETLNAAAAINPQGRAAEQQLIQQMSAATQIQDFSARIAEHSKRFPNSGNRHKFIELAVTAMTNKGNVVEAASFLKELTDVPAAAYHVAANYMGANDSLRPLALEFIEKGIANTKSNNTKPVHYAPSEWQENQRMVRSNLQFVKGAILAAQGQVSDALEAYANSVETGGVNTDDGVYARYAVLLQSEGNSNEALAVSRLALGRGVMNQDVMQTFRTEMQKTGADERTINDEIELLKKQSRPIIAQRLSASRLNLPMIDGTFSDMNGNPIKISDWSGKVVVLDYWATWCGPCRQSFPGMQKLYEKYKSNPNVQFAIVNVWERVDNPTQKITEFLDKNKDLTFPVFYDPGDKVVRSYGVTGIPTKFFLGKDGRVQFKEVGNVPEEQFLIEASNKIEALLGME